MYLSPSDMSYSSTGLSCVRVSKGFHGAVPNMQSNGLKDCTRANVVLLVVVVGQVLVLACSYPHKKC